MELLIQSVNDGANRWGSGVAFSAFLNCKKIRREVWTVRLPKFVVHTSTKSINNFFYLYEASVRRY